MLSHRNGANRTHTRRGLLAVETFLLAMQCTNPIELRNPEITVPCGKCRSCRIARSRVWTMRLVHELTSHEGSCFATLTYDEASLPDPPELSKRTLQNFIKRLRERVKPTSIKYYASGEYGDLTQRPHYHAILFGLPPTQQTKELLQEEWWNGAVHLGTVTPDSARYVADYIQKQLDGLQAKKDGRVQPFALKSNGLGKRFALDNQEHIKRDGLRLRGVPQQLPRYYLELLDIDTNEIREQARERYNKWKRERYKTEPRPSRIRLVEEDANKQADTNVKAQSEIYRKGVL